MDPSSSIFIPRSRGPLRGGPLAARGLLVILLLAAACTGSVEQRIAEQRALQDAGRFKETVEPLRKILTEAPEDAEANYLLGIALVRTGQQSLAVWPLDKASRGGDPEYAVPSGLLLASTFLTIKSYEDAVQAASRVIDENPEHAEALETRAHALLGASFPEQALDDADRLIALRPGEYQPLLLKAGALWDLKRLDDAEEVHLNIREVMAEKGDPDLAIRGCVALAKFYVDKREDKERGEEVFAECATENPLHPIALSHAADFYEANDENEKAIALYQNALELAPESASFLQVLTEKLRADGRPDEAETAILGAVDREVPGALALLANHYKTLGESAKALATSEKLVEAMGREPEDQMLFAQADLLIDLGELDRAEELARRLKEPSYQALIAGRLHLERGRPAAALRSLEKGLKRWPNNAGGRYLAGVAAERLGNLVRAASEYREAIRSDKKGTDAALALARVHLQRAEWDLAAEFARQHVDSRPVTGPEPHFVYARALVARGDHKTATEILERFLRREDIDTDPFRPAVAAEIAGIERDRGGPKAAVRFLEQRGLDLTDASAEPALRSLVENLLLAKREPDALRRVDAALAANPDSAALHELRGRVLLRQGSSPQAMAAFQSATERVPGYGPALAGLGHLAVEQGDTAEAIRLFDQAAGAETPDREAAYAAAQLVLASGDAAGARKRLDKVLLRNPGHPGANNDLAWLLAEQGEDLERAHNLARRAVRLVRTPESYDTLGWVQLKRGELEAAIASFRKALEGPKQAPAVRYHLALALAANQETDAARGELESALAAGGFPEADAARAELARLSSGEAGGSR